MESIVENVIYTTIPEEITKSHQRITSDEFCECLFAKYDCAFFKCVLFLPRHQVRFSFVNSTRAEVFLKESLSFRGVRLPVRVAERKVRVEVCNVPYEVHNKDIATTLSTYGEMLTIESEYYAKRESLLTGIRFITMKIKKPIPSLIRVSNYTARVFYRGQTATCFKCKEMGHVMQNCPRNANVCSRCGSREHWLHNGCSGAWENPPIPSGETTNNNTFNAHNLTESQPLANDSSNNEQLSDKDHSSHRVMVGGNYTIFFEKLQNIKRNGRSL